MVTMSAHRKSVLRSALLAMGLSDVQAENRLSDMLIEEVSYVDRAANRRKFLVVKNEGVNVEDQQTGDATLVLTSTVKESMLRVLTDALERLVAITDTVKVAEESAGDGTADVLPDVLTSAFDEVASLLSGAVARYAAPMDKEENEASKALQAISDSAAQLATAAKGDGGLDEAGVAALLASLSALSGSDGAVVEGAGASGDEGAGDGVASSEHKGDSKLAAALAQIAEAASGLGDSAGADGPLKPETVVGLRQLAAMLNELVQQYPEPGADSAAPSDGADAGSADGGNSTDAMKSSGGVAADTVDEVTKAMGAAKAKLESILAQLNIDISGGMEEAFDKIWQSIRLLRDAAQLDELLATDVQQSAPDTAKSEPGDGANAGDAAQEQTQKVGRRMSAGRLNKLKSAIAALTALVDELEANKQLTEDQKKSIEKYRAHIADAEKRLAAETAQRDPESGAYGSVGTGGDESDAQAGPAQAEDVEALAELMKRLDGLSLVVKQIAETPDVPASRSEPEPAAGVQKNREPARRRGGPWVL